MRTEQPPCKCNRYGFPHRFTWQCAHVEQYEEEAERDYEQELRLDERGRIADMAAELNRGVRK